MRINKIQRKTKETNISCQVNLDGSGKSSIDLEIGFLQHMLETFAKHSLIDITLLATGDIHVDQHHLVEDIGITLGKCIAGALGEKKGIYRSGFVVYPMDETFSVVSLDFGGRPYLQYNVGLSRQFCGDFNTDLLEDFFQSLTTELRATIAIRLIHGRSDHHKIEAIFKGLAKSMRFAIAIDDRIRDFIPSTKGVIE